MDSQTIAILVFGGMCLFALIMFVLERRAVARRKAEGKWVDVSNILAFGSEAVTGKDPLPPKRK